MTNQTDNGFKVRKTDLGVTGNYLAAAQSSINFLFSNSL